MMKKYTYYGIIVLGLLAALFLYAFYRTTDTFVNRILIAIFSRDSFHELRDVVTAKMPLPDGIIYSVPEALWVFCATLASKNIYVTIGRYSMNCVYLPISFAYLWEVFQLLDITKGHCDFWDIILSSIAFVLAKKFFKPPYGVMHFFKTFTFQVFLFFVMFAIVYLSHVV